MSINQQMIDKIREDLSKLKEILEKKGIIDIEKHLLDFLRRLDAVKLAKKHHCSLDVAIDTIEYLQKSGEVRKIIMALE